MESNIYSIRRPAVLVGAWLAALLVLLPAAAGSGEFHATDAQLDRLIEQLVADNPEIQAADSASRSLGARAPQDGALPDPQLTLRYFAKTPETRVGPQREGLEFSQSLPWKGKRGLQVQRAESLARSASWQARDLERTRVAELKRTYYETAYLQQALRINREERELLLRFESIALRRYSTGSGIQQHAIKVQTDLTRLADQEIALREALDASRRRIADLIGSPTEPLDLQIIDLPRHDFDLDRTALEEAAIANHPRVRAHESRIEADRAWSQRQGLDRRPDFRVGLGYTLVGRRDDPAAVLNPPADNGQDILALTFGINLPVYRGRIRAGVAEAEEQIRADHGRLTGDRNRLRYRVQQATLRLESLDERIRLYTETLLPQAGESLASAEAAYTTDRQDFLDLLDAERVLFQVRRTYHRMVSDSWIALADLEQAVGQAVPGQEVSR